MPIPGDYPIEEKIIIIISVMDEQQTPLDSAVGVQCGIKVGGEGGGGRG